MHCTIVTVGSRGDVEPYLALASGLVGHGHQVRVATHEEFRDLAEGSGAGFAAIAGNPSQLIRSDLGAAWQASRRSPIATMRGLVALAEPLLDSYLDDTRRAMEGTDVAIFGVLGVAAYHVAEALKIPAVGAWLQPLTPTAAFPHILLPVENAGPLNRVSHLAFDRLAWRFVAGSAARWRKALDLEPLPFDGPFRRIEQQQMALLYGFSSHVVPRPHDWPARVHVPGYWFTDPPPDWRPPGDLLAFLESGPAPVYFGFGSRVGADPGRASDVVQAISARLGLRAVVNRGWGGLAEVTPSDQVFVTDGVRHDWLFPRMRAVVHHGGAGTTAAGLRAGVPSVVVPTFADQFFWARRVQNLGVGASIDHFEAPSLAAALRSVLDGESTRLRARTLGRRIRSEDGVGRAAGIIERTAV